MQKDLQEKIRSVTSGSGNIFIGSSRMRGVLPRLLVVADKAPLRDFRSVASTTLNKSSLFSVDWIEMQFAHVPQ